jgi:hypothetical protein
MWPLIECRRRPTLPHSFPCSTIGPAGLNFRVRDGNGCIPRGKITDNLMPRTCGSTCYYRAANSKILLESSFEDDASQLNRLGNYETITLIAWGAAKPFGRRALGKFYGQAERAISTGKLNASLRLHPQPINQLVLLGPS